MSENYNAVVKRKGKEAQKRIEDSIKNDVWVSDCCGEEVKREFDGVHGENDVCLKCKQVCEVMNYRTRDFIRDRVRRQVVLGLREKLFPFKNWCRRNDKPVAVVDWDDVVRVCDDFVKKKRL